MKIRFWGTRGSLPVSLSASQVRDKLIAAFTAAIGRQLDSAEKIAAYVDNELGFEIAGTYGGHSPCVQIEAGGAEHIVCDMGSGARPFGQSMLARFGPDMPQTYHVFMSHLHWDHIMGFPFFTPAYIPGNRIVIYGCHAELEEAFRRQQAEPSFPVDFSQLNATIEFVYLEPGRSYDIAGVRVTPKLQRHTGDSYGYRFEELAGTGKIAVYSTDSEHALDDNVERESFIEFFRAADVVIFDAMYSLIDAFSIKADWGHSSNIYGVELCQMAGVKCFCMFHHEPAYDDATIASVLAETRRFEEITRTGEPLEVIAAYDGLELVL
ncbi:MAG: MBL fold metallo-hydrolase [Gallionellaceae bacterium]|nr:MBL fold metallo-hydrolase [Gallionellaceae bacterium]